MSDTLLPPGWYRVLIHGLKKEGTGVFIHATTLPGGERLRLRIFDNQIRKLINACSHQAGLPKNLKGGQALLNLSIHPQYGNKLLLIERVTKVTPVESDVELERAVQYCEFQEI